MPTPLSSTRLLPVLCLGFQVITEPVTQPCRATPHALHLCTGKSQEEIKALRLAGEEVTESFEVYAFVSARCWMRNAKARPRVRKPHVLPQRQCTRGRRLSQRYWASTCAQVPEVAFSGDTTADFFTNPEGGSVLADALRAKVLLLEMT
jgi:hypothetical protein